MVEGPADVLALGDGDEVDVDAAEAGAAARAFAAP